MSKTLIFDLETSPRKVWTWGEYEQNILRVAEESYILCFAYKWLGDKQTKVVSLSDFKGYKKDKKDDTDVVKVLHGLLCEASIVIAHNGDRFDIKWANKQFIKHNLEPTSPYISIDTLKVARRYFNFYSNKLDRLGEFLEVGRKVKHEGLDLWFKVMDGDKKAIGRMAKYAKQDVVLLEQIYYKLRPYMQNHPNINQVDELEQRCPACGSDRLQRRGTRATNSGLTKYQTYQCRSCFKWSRGKPIRTNIDIR